MKICIIGYPRSRSSMLLDTISKFYKIPILGESINQLTRMKLTYRNNNYKNLLKNCLRTKDGVIRFHPLQLLDHPFNPVVYDFELFDFNQYDKIYFTFRRDIVDIIASEFVAQKLKKHTYQSKESLFENIVPMTLTDFYHFIIKEHIYSEILVEKLREYFTLNNIQYQDLYYDSIPEYISKQFVNVETAHVETNYNYQNLVTNYNDILPLYQTYKTQYEQR